MGKIDFVIPWVDGTDREWFEEKQKYSETKDDYGSAMHRFRSWDNLQFFFRGVEKFTPWVNRVYFVTWGHLPPWLNTDNEKLRIVKHEEFIPKEYLPTFNSSAIMLNLHRIPGLSENFVLFNDDTFLLKPSAPEVFFQKDLPCDEFSLNPIIPKGDRFFFAHTVVNNVRIINQYFDKNAAFKKNRSKYLNLKYGKENIRTLLLLSWGCFLGFKNHHLPLAHKRSTFDILWEKEKDALEETCLHRFRDPGDLNDWLMRYWNLCSGDFMPRSAKFGRYFDVGRDNSSLCSYIREQKGNVICMNDNSTEIDFEKAKQEINAALEAILPEKSSFEKD